MFILVENLNTVNHAELLRWIAPLRAERFGAFVIVEAPTQEHAYMMLNIHKPAAAVALGSSVSSWLTGQDSDTAYSIRSNLNIYYGGDVLLLPNQDTLEWDKLESALDRFEELL